VAVAIPLLLLFIQFSSAFWFSCLIALVVGFALFEYNALVLADESKPTQKILCALGVICFVTESVFRFSHFPAIIPFSLAVFTYAICRRKPDQTHFLFLAKSTFGYLYVATLLGTLSQIRGMENEAWGVPLIFFLLITIWISDSAAFVMGSFVRGKWKLSPHVSPNKSWEGSLAAFFAVLLVVAIFHRSMVPFLSMPQALTLGSIICVSGQLGDLSESYLKRAFGVKDSGKLFPGHGGMLDRVDAFIFASPVMFIYLKLFV
jgi:phosphatidate cytidylyltransferase